MAKPDNHVTTPGQFEQARANGKTFKFSHCNPGIRKAFRSWVEEIAIARLEDARKRLPPDVFARREAFFNEQILAGAYDWGFPLDMDDDRKSMGTAISRAMQEGEGMAKLFRLLTAEHHGELSNQEIEAAFKDNSNGLVEAMKRALDPNSASPSQETGTAPEAPPPANA